MSIPALARWVSIFPSRCGGLVVESYSKDECKDIECHKQLFSEFQTAFDDACGGFGGIKGKIEADMATPTAEIFIVGLESIYILRSTYPCFTSENR